MDGLTVVIPSRNEKYLEQTIRNVLANARGEIEILAVLDGWIPEPQIVIGDDRVEFIHFEESIGQRQGINFAAKRAKGKYVMKLDAHCAVDEGFDVKLIEDCEYDWTVIPRMYNLDINTFKPKMHKRTDYMYMRVREDGQFRAEYYTGKEYREMHRRSALIDDTMCCMGPCFFMHTDRFWELGGCDEGHGSWGSQGIEVACKAWLSGGALKVNKKTWFSHWFRGGGGPGFPYKLSGRQVARAREYATKLWIGNNWEQAVRDFDWMIEKFNPPGWENGAKKKSKEIATKMEEKPDVYKPRNAKSHVHGRPMSVDNLVANIEHYWDYRKKSRAKDYHKVLQFFADLHAGKSFELESHPYFEYVKDGFKKGTSNKTILEVVEDSIKLYKSIVKDGMRDPIDLWVERGKFNLSRGSRRLAIMKAMGKQQISVRIYNSRDFMGIMRASTSGHVGPITKTAQAQHKRWGWKCSDKYWIHNYTPLYDQHCSHLAFEECKVLEIGVQRGPSLRLWEEAFPKAHVYGVDIDLSKAKLAEGIERIKMFKGSQTDKKFNEEVIKPIGPFDIIVDDASHIPEHQIIGYDLLWDSVKPGGWYIIEDLYYRNYFRNKGTNNMMAKISHIVDEMNEKCEVEAVHQYYNIVFIKKRAQVLKEHM